MLLVAPPLSYRISPYISAARSLQIKPVVVSTGKYSLVHEVASGIHVDFSDFAAALDTILRAVAELDVVAVIGTDDSTVELANRVANALRLPHNSAHSVRLTRRKDLARQALQSSAIPLPEFQVFALPEGEAEAIESRLDIRYPFVVKPLALSGSRGVIRVNSGEEFRSALKRISRILAREPYCDEYEKSHVLLEQYIPGEEVAVEAILSNGRLTVLAVFDKPDPLHGPFFEETYYITPSRLGASILKKIEQRLAQACTAYGLLQGPVHAEFRLHDNDAWIIELAARTIGGQCARMLELRIGRSLETLVLDNALQNDVTGSASTQACGVLMIPIPAAGLLRRVEGVLAAQNILYIEHIEISVREGYELVPLPEGASYLGFIFARAPTAELAERALRQAFNCLNIVVAPIINVKVI